MRQRLPVSFCQHRLAVVWLIGSGLVFALLIAQTVGGKYGTQADKAFGWLLPTVLPTLLLIVGAVASEARRAESMATVDRFAFRMSLGLSAFYLVLVLATSLVQPFSSMTPLELMTTSHLWLGPVQGVVGIALGVFFTSRQIDCAGPGSGPQGI